MISVRTVSSSALAAFLALATAVAGRPALASEEPPLPPDEAFRYELVDAGDAVLVNWSLAPGYYLYKKKLSFATTSTGITLNDAVLPSGEVHEDEYFGRQEIYRNAFSVRLPYAGSGLADIEVRSQGCADLGICYPPQRWSRTIALAADSQAGRTLMAGDGGSGLLPGAETLGDSEFLPPDLAFQPVVSVLDGRTLEVAWRIEPGYYLYKDKLAAKSLSESIALGPAVMPKGKLKHDEFFGETEVYYESVFAKIPLQFELGGELAAEFGVTLAYQGCAEDGICYPPLKRHAIVNLSGLSAAILPAGDPPPADAEVRVAAAGPAVKESVQDRLARTIREGRLGIVVGIFFIAGLGLALTPCVLPMIPILSGIIAGEGENVTPGRGFFLSLIYVLGMALTYTIAGALFAKAGQQAQAVFQQPWILVAFSLLFVVLALSMFGLFELQMPSSVQSKLATLSGQQKSGTVLGAFVMGALSSLIVTACVAPPLVAALAVIGQSGDVVRGGAALFALSMGMGAPLLVVGASAGKLLPKAGPWMVGVKIGFGFLMLGLAIYVLARLLPGPVILAMWAVLIFMGSVFLGAMTPLSADSGSGAKLRKGFGVLGLLYGAFLLLGAVIGNHDPLRPLQIAGSIGGGAEGQHAGLEFQRVKTTTELDGLLRQAAASGQPVMLDFYADWCVSCKEMEKYTFTDTTVHAALGSTLLLQADVTANDADDQALLKRFGLFGPPSIIFFGPNGQERRNYMVVGMMWPEEFAPHVVEATASQSLSARID